MYRGSIALMIAALFHATLILANDLPLRQYESNLELVDAGNGNKADMNVHHQRQIHTQFDNEVDAINAEHHRTSGNAADAGTGNGHHQEASRHGGRAARLVRSVYLGNSRNQARVVSDNWGNVGAGEVYTDQGTYRQDQGHAEETGSE